MKMTVGYLADILKRASDYICKVAENKPITEEDIHAMSNIMAVMHTFIRNTEIVDDD